MRKLHEKAQAAYFQGLQPLRRDIFSPRGAEPEQDELSIFSGRTPRTVVTKSNRPQRISPSMSSSSAVSPLENNSSPSSSQNGSTGSDYNQRNSQSPAAEAFPGLDSQYLPAVHPVLMSELRSFEGQLDAQIHQTNSYYASDAGGAAVGHQQHPYAVAEQYAEQPQAMQQDPQWYQTQAQAHAAVEHAQHHPSVSVEHPQHHSSVSPPSTAGSQHQAQYQPMQYPHPQTHNPEHYRSHQQPVKAPQPLPPPPPPTAAPQQHPHDIPMYGGVYSKGAAPPQYQDHHPYAQVRATASTQSVPEYDSYAGYANASAGQLGNGQSVPDQRSELWTVPPGADVHAADGEQMSYQTQTPPEQDHLANHAQYRQQPRHAPAQHPQYSQHGQHLQHPQHPQHPQHQTQPASMQPQHTGQSMHTPPSLQPQHTGQSMHHQHPPQIQHPGQHAQPQAYAYPQHHQYQEQPPQMIPPAYQPQPVVSNGYSLTETWTSFIQQELPGGARR